MDWTHPHISKIYEALGAIGDDRLEFIEGKNEAKMYSSSRNKFYTVTWNDSLTKFMSNDNSAFFVGQLSYPIIAVLLKKGKLTFQPQVPELLKGIKWKDINQRFKNNFDKTIDFVLKELQVQGKDSLLIKSQVDKISHQIQQMKIGHFGKKVRPPSGY